MCSLGCGRAVNLAVVDALKVRVVNLAVVDALKVLGSKLHCNRMRMVYFPSLIFATLIYAFSIHNVLS